LLSFFKGTVEVESKMIEALGADRVAAVIVEPVLGTGG
jgi:adenosylmethionine-8-amino-7-oxononanoate aminotransferase